ncbi:MAG: transposase [Clostridiales bacterium]|nr:transposase [Clostridiales bacterium]
MGEKDLTEKLLEDYEDVFADIVTVLLFGGEEVVKEDELEATGAVSQYKIGKTIHGQERDVSKHWKEKYRSLYGIMDVPEKLRPYVSDYKINVFEIAWLDDETVKKFRSDFRIVADYFVQARKNKHYIPSEEQIKHVNEVLDLMSVLIGDNRFEKAQNTARKGKVTNMYSFLEEAENNGIEKGITQGMEQANRSTAIALHERDVPDDEIASIVSTDILTVKQWIYQ